MKFLTIERKNDGYFVMLYDTKQGKSGKSVGCFQKEKWAYDGAWCAMKSMDLPLFSSAKAGFDFAKNYRKKKTIML